MARRSTVKAGFVLLAIVVVAAAGLVAHSKQKVASHKSAIKAHQSTAEPVAKPTVQIAPALQAAWKSALTGVTTPVDIAVYDQNTGQTAQYSNVASRTFNTASTMKLSILEAILLRNQAQGIDGLTSTQLPVAQRMIENSDNDAATTLVGQAGSTRGMNSFFAQVGATSSVMADHWGLTQTTALDQLKVVNQIAHPTVLHNGSVAVANQLLDNVEADQRWGVSAGVPAGVTVRLKNGWLQDGSWIVNSIGYVQGQGADYSIAVYTDTDTTEQAGITVIEALSTATWNYLSTL